MCLYYGGGDPFTGSYGDPFTGRYNNFNMVIRTVERHQIFVAV